MEGEQMYHTGVSQEKFSLVRIDKYDVGILLKF